MRILFLGLLAFILAGCNLLGSSVCGSGEYLVFPEDDEDEEAIKNHDLDGDGYVEAYFKCGVIWDNFGLRDAENTTFTFSPTLDAHEEESFEVETTYSPATQITVPNDSLEVGAVITPESGSGSHLIYFGNFESRGTGGLLEGTIEVLDSRSGGNTVSEEMSNAEEWKIRWKAIIIDPQDSSSELQRIEGEDWIEVIDG